jgi:hypothetical protein
MGGGISRRDRRLLGWMCSGMWEVLLGITIRGNTASKDSRKGGERER